MVKPGILVVGAGWLTDTHDENAWFYRSALAAIS
jgi:hypothetical protein